MVSSAVPLTFYSYIWEWTFTEAKFWSDNVVKHRTLINTVSKHPTTWLKERNALGTFRNRNYYFWKTSFSYINLGTLGTIKLVLKRECKAISCDKRNMEYKLYAGCNKLSLGMTLGSFFMQNTGRITMHSYTLYYTNTLWNLKKLVSQPSKN